ncbi:MAG TPA: hypothetical protein VGH66_17880, partial [Acidimicrobiales bacterium]
MNGIAVIFLCMSPAALLALLFAMSSFEDALLNNRQRPDDTPREPSRGCGHYRFEPWRGEQALAGTLIEDEVAVLSEQGPVASD